jgi:hypothetical protein
MRRDESKGTLVCTEGRAVHRIRNKHIRLQESRIKLRQREDDTIVAISGPRSCSPCGTPALRSSSSSATPS